MPPSLLPILAHARAGALEHALRLFHDAGLDTVTDNPAVLSLKGRLLKDQARLADGEARRALYDRSAEAYGAAGAISGATYPLINAASLSLLAGESDRARTLAETVLARLDAGDDEPDTPYWAEATRAEAQLLLGHGAEARATLRAAVALAPLAWEDHAATLRQFELILAVQGEDAAWLEVLRPPRALHFAGHLGVDPDDDGLKARVAAALEAERVGFGYGALAAGADIVIAEALIDRGAELHLVLPAGRETFRAASVSRMGGDWTDRFDTVLKAAVSMTSVAPAGEAPSPLTLELAGRAAMGRAVMQARLLASEAVQLVVLEDGAEAAVSGGSAWAAAAWSQAGRRGLVLSAPRARAMPREGDLVQGEGERLAAVLALAPASGDTTLADRLPAFWAALAEAEARPDAPPVWTGAFLLLSFATCAEAAAAARAAAALLGEGRIAGAAGVVRAGPSVDGSTLLLGRPLETAGRLLPSVPPGAALVTANFAAVLCLGPEDRACPCEPVGELPPANPADLGWDEDLSVFSLRLG